MMKTSHPIVATLHLFALAMLLLPTAARAASADDVSDLGQWSGLEIHNDAEPSAVLSTPGSASFTYPDGDKGWHRVGMSSVHDGAADWRPYFGLRFEVRLPDDAPLQGRVSIQTAPTQEGSRHVSNTFVSEFGLVGAGWHTVTLPLASFDYEKGRPSVLFTIKTVALEATHGDGKAVEIKLRNLRLVEAERIAVASEIRSRSAKAGESVEYELKLTNCTDVPQMVNLSRNATGWEVMATTITPSAVLLAPRENKVCQVKVKVSERVAPGGRESQLIQAVANGHPAGEIEYITLSHLEHPYILHTPERWEAVRQKVKDYEWAQEAAQKYIADADKWEVPERAEGKISRHTNGEYIFVSSEERKMLGASVAYQLTGDKKYAEKGALFLRRLCDPDTGFPRTLQGSSGNLVKEGNFFQYTAMGYDMIYNAGVLTDEDHDNIARTFRLYHEIIDESCARGGTSNWTVAELCGAIYSALAIQDMATAERFIEGPGGILDEISHGLMADGWWHECSIGYNTWVASEFTQLALAMQPWGVDYVDHAFPLGYSKEFKIPYADVEQRKQDHYGKPFQKWGPIPKPYIKLKEMWDSLIPYIDFNGIMFATNDSAEKRFASNAYEIAYAVYGDPNYASIIALNGGRDLLYGVAELPEDPPKLGEGSAYSDNAGVAMLRSRAEGKPFREKIQAVLKYGTHGGYHGHFDRASLNSLMRYGRSFYNPQHIWYSYPNFMYAFFVQTSLPHNMVVVDMKQQEPVESHKLLFSTGDLMQATAVETKARWSRPPYGGLVYEWFKGGTFREKVWAEGRYMPVPENEPVYGSIGEYSERVTQRRLMAVTDDYVLLADYLDAPEQHVFDCLFNIKGFMGIEADELELVRRTDSMDPDPVLPAQLITDCHWYDAKGTAKVSFETQYGPDADHQGTRIYGLDGVLKMDVYSAWPREREVMIGTLPESHGVNRKFWYSVRGDGNMLAEGKFGAWILGRDDIDVSVEGLEKLTLTTKADFNAKRAPKTLFWADAVVVTADGKEYPLSEFDLSFAGIDDSAEDNLDYYGGPVKIAGREFKRSTPANPTKPNEDATITIDLTDFDAVRFKAHVGGDYPLGDETWRRKSLSFRTQGKQTRYLTVIEPFEAKSNIKSVTASSPDEVTVELLDGRTQVLTIENLDTGQDVKVSIQEYQDGALIREEFSGSEPE